MPKNYKPVKDRKKINSRSLFLAIILFFILLGFSLPVKNIFAQIPGTPTPTVELESVPEIKKSIGEKIVFFIERAAKIVYKNALDYFLQRMAYDTATWLATGDKGQAPLYWEEGIGAYIRGIGDEAIGKGLDELARGTFGVSLCEPYNANVKLQLILQTKQAFEPQRATCTFNDILKTRLLNVTVNGQRPDLRLLDRENFHLLAQYFNPRANELGAQFILYSNISTRRAQDEQMATLIRSIEADVKSLKSPIGDLGFESIKTPALDIKNWLGATSEKSVDSGWTTLTGDIAADALRTFTNTLASKFLQRLQKGVLAGKGGATGGGPRDFGSYSTRGADVSYAEFIIPSFRGGGSVDVLGKLSSCPPENQARLFDNCIIDSRLATAIDQQLTVRQAIEQGYLDPNKPFGFLSDGSEPTYTNGYPYRSLVFMRKYRILPVTWELAALYIKDINNTNETFTLAQVMGTPADNFQAFSSSTSPFYHLVDPNWVLKIPDYECRVEGPGPQISQRVNISVDTPDGFGGTIKVNEETLQRANYCADEQTCIVQNPNGTCQKYGYCTKEKNTWNFQGQECLPQFSTCETYVKRATNDKTSYLAATMQTCDASQVGCRWYSMYKTSSGFWADDIWNQTTNNFGTDNQITFGDVYNRTDLGDISYTRYFNNQVKTCSSKDEGCNKFIELTNISAPDGYEATTQSIFQYIQNNQAVYSEAGILNSYGEWGLIQEKNMKQAPSYLNCPTDINDPNRDSRCDDYAQSCTATEVGCSLYTPINGDPPVPAVLGNNDYCSAACVGYDQYLEVPTYFERRANPAASPVIENIIPASATSCRLSDVGCEQFTNLDEVAQGGEGIKYFNFIRECILPNDPAAKIFYTWEGSDTAGYQLKTWRLQSAGGAAPTGDSCDPADDPLNCRTFIDAEGTSWSRDIMTVTYATDDCHPFRRSVDSSVIYGIESFSRSCQAAAVGCKEYRGNQGNVVTIVVNDDFESGTSEGWLNGFNSSESVYVGGHSMRLTGAQAHKRVNEIINQGKNYTISFWARSSGATATLSFEIQAYQPSQITQTDNKTLSFINQAKAQAIAYFEELVPIAGSQRSFGSVNLTDEWQYYRLGPVNFDRAVVAYEYLQTNATNVYLDNIIMREVTDSYYLIADSWETPAICNQPFVGAQLGCQAYRDTRGNQVNLLGFTALCSDSKVGCKALIDTKNSNSPFSQTYNTGNNVFSDPQGLDDVVVEADSIVYLVDDQDKYCASQFAGCTLAGEAIIDRQSAGAVVAFNDKFIIDSPENYNATMCGVGGLYCEQYTNERTGSAAFLIDPGNRTCEYKLLPGRTSANWYQTGTEQLCPDLQTYPYQPVPQTDPNYDGWVGLCSPESMGCSQYIDPEGNPDVTKSSYFYLEQSVNTAACNGLVDRERGCRLFNKTDGTPQAFTPSAYTPATPDGSVPLSSANAAENSANIILQVQKDRACDEWLYCKTRIESYDSEGNRDDKCFDIGLCNRLDDSGECIGFPNTPNTEIIGQQISGSTNPSVENLRLLSGYTKAGMSWSGFASGNGTTPGYLPYYLMSQVGNEANILYNPSFENVISPAQSLESPFLNWLSTDSVCGSGGICRIASDNQSISGLRAALLSVSPNTTTSTPSSLYLRQDLVLPSSEYVLSGYIRWDSIPNTPSLGGANIVIRQGGAVLQEFGIKQDYSIGWQTFAIKFRNSQNNINISLELSQVREGQVYFDGFSILPSLQVSNNPEKIISQRCRLYPESSSSECNYVKGTKSYTGWPGFCAEVDPNNPAYCINWWPVDIVRGSLSQINEQPLIFEQKVPLYYCLDSSGRKSSNPNYLNYVHDKYQYTVRRGNQGFLFASGQGCYWPNTNFGQNFAIGGCSRGPGPRRAFFNVGAENSLYEYEIEKIVLTKAPGARPEYPYQVVLTDQNRMSKSELINILGNWSTSDCGGTYSCGPTGTCSIGCGVNLNNQIAADEFVWGTGCSFTPGGGYAGRSQDVPVEGACGDSADQLEFVVIFDNQGRPKQYGIFMDDYSGDRSEGTAWTITYHLRESCLAVAKVGDILPNGEIEAYPYFTRLENLSSYKVGEIDYGYTTDASPFGSVYQSGLSRYFQDDGGLLQDEKDPQTWDSRPAWPGNQPLYVEAENPLRLLSGSLNSGPNIRAGTPFATRGGQVPTGQCVGGIFDGHQCINNSQCQGTQMLCEEVGWSCTSNLDCWDESGYCDITQERCVGGPLHGVSCTTSEPYACHGSWQCLEYTSTEGECRFNNVTTYYSICRGGPRDNLPCNTADNIKLCYQGDGMSFGTCVGASDPNWFKAFGSNINNGINRLQNLFIRSMGVWEWKYENNKWQYVENELLDWSLAVGTDPQIGNVQVNGQTSAVNLPNGGTIKLTFTSNIANDQLPLRSYSIIWGDGSANTSVRGYFNERPSQGDPHVLYHSYSSLTPGPHSITITVEDNWGRISSFTRNNAVCVGAGCGGIVVID